MGLSTLAQRLIVSAFVITSSYGQSARISGVDQSLSPGQLAVTSLSLASNGQSISAIQFDFQWDSPLGIQLIAGGQLTSAAKIMYRSSPGPQTLRCLIVGMNQTTIADGELLKISLTLESPLSSAVTAQVRIINVTASSPNGTVVAVNSMPINVQIQGTGSSVRVDSITPTSASAGSSGLMLTVSGAGFLQGMLVNFGNVSLVSNVITPTQLTVQVPSSLLTSAHAVDVSVAGSNSVPFVVGSAMSVTCTPTAGPVTLGNFYSQTCNVAGGTAPYRWTVSSLPTGLSLTVSASGSLASVSGTPTIVGVQPITITAIDNYSIPNAASANVTLLVQVTMTGVKVGVFRNGMAFLMDSNGNGIYDAGVDRYIPNFVGPGGFVAGDMPVTGDWTGNGHPKVGIYRTSTGTWYLDANDNGVFDAGDLTYSFGGVPGDKPVVGDWMGLGKSCIGLYRSNGGVWLLDLNCNGEFENIPVDAFFPFGGVVGDVPVVGSWSGGTTRVGLVRRYAPGGVPQGEPFYWVLDSAAVNAGSLPADHPPAARAFAFGGLANDVFVTGDWYNTGTSSAGVYRNGFWVLDAAPPDAPQVNHVPGLAFGIGGVPGDVPVTGRW